MRSAKAVALSGLALPSGRAVGPRVIPALDALIDQRHRFFQFQGNRRAASLARGLIAIGRRAAAFAAELKQLPCDEALRPWLPELASALRTLASVARPHGGCPPLVACWTVGTKREALQDFEVMARSLAALLSRAVVARKQRDVAAIKQWARTATLKQAHAATKPVSFVSAHSASPSKAHRGELTPQAAADAGREEWATIWQASDEEVTGALDQIMQVLPGDGEVQSTFFAVRDGPFVSIELPLITADALRLTCRSFRSGTAVGLDWVRLQHLSLLSQAALEQLALLLESIERDGSSPAA